MPKIKISSFSFSIGTGVHMRLHQLSAFIYLYFFLLLHRFIFSVASLSPGLYHAPENIAVNCGSSGHSTAPDGRPWVGDVGSSYVSSRGSKTKSLSSKAIHQQPFSRVPYMTARISRQPFTYKFQVSPGHKLIRLHFYPTSYPGFERSKAFFTVKTGPFTLLRNFSASLTADALGLQTFAREFCLHIVSTPVGLYHTPDGDSGVQVVGKKYRLPIDDSLALEMVQRLTIGGSSILPMEDTGMFREWVEDSDYLLESSVMPAIGTMMRIKYTNIPTYAAPPKVYQTSRSKVSDEQANKNSNFTWKVSVDLGFGYLIRLHFCELEYDISKIGERVFAIFINNQMAEDNADVITWTAGNGVAMYRDYVAMMGGDRMAGKSDLLITLSPHINSNSGGATEHTDAILKGLEVFKLSNLENSLAGVNPSPMRRALARGNPSHRKFVYACGGNGIATYVLIFLVSLNTIVYHLRIKFFGEKFGASTQFERLCRRFTLAEIQLMTNSFSGDIIIGKGGFGNVYKGLIDNGATTVAIKRLNPSSNQGEREFLTEIKTLSTLRHPHLVSLMGYCDESHDESHEMILIYEYMEHGTLADRLYRTHEEDANTRHLSWEQRLNICIGAAQGLDYLHTGTQHCIIHRDVKTTNILLDKDWVAKISDFGLCKIGISHSHTHVSTEVKGTFGYLDPEYWCTQRLTKKSDVFAFGMVLLEALCGRPALDRSQEEEPRNLADWTQKCIKEGKLDQIVDPRLRDQISSHCLRLITNIARKCLHKCSGRRPTMADVVVSLQRALALQRGRGDSSIEDEENEKDVFSEDDDRQMPQIDEDKQLDDDVQCDRHNQVPFRSFSSAEIRAATNNFDEKIVIRESDSCKMYKGWMDNGTFEVANKRLKTPPSDVLRIKIKAQYQLCHPNLMCLIGYCEQEGEPIVVHDNMSIGSLRDHLYGKGKGYNPLPWKRRLEICIHAARGLQYLHSGAAESIIHGNIKSTTILLDENWVAKISLCLGQELETRIGITSRICNNMGYLDPEYVYILRLTQKSDVYSFGVVLLEALCGKRPHDSSQHGDLKNLVCRFRASFQGKTMDEIIDPYLVGRIEPECLKEFTKITWNCLMDRGGERPSMDDVVGSLQIALQLQQTWASKDEEEDALFRAATARACNNIVSCDGAFDIVYKDGSNCYAERSSRDMASPKRQISDMPDLRRFSFSELKDATKHFHSNRLLGEGALGKVYKGWIAKEETAKMGSGLAVAVKKLRSEDFQGVENFTLHRGFKDWQSEIKFLKKFSHPNLIKLLGQCRDHEKLLLVYEFMENGSLDNQIFRRSGQPLPWETRLKILTGAARGLAFLHTSEDKVIHTNFHVGNILLDESFNAKISGFSLAKWGPKDGESYLETRVLGTCGYAAPEYIATGHLYVKSDVYCFGAVLVEMLTGQSQSRKLGLVEWFGSKSYDRRKLQKMVDSSLEGKYPLEAAFQLVQLALRCLGTQPNTRPSMTEVVDTLESISKTKKL
ncbi:Non-specific serine/threonine protein kinase [Bertholletia excelsa]